MSQTLLPIQVAMIETTLRTIAILASLVVVVSFGLFAIDETRAASGRSAAEVAGHNATQVANPSPTEERARERAHGSVREAIDDANDVLAAPFAGVTGSSNSQWVNRGVPMLLALLVYGLGIGFLARFAQGRS
jgi:hypothetical protein